MKSYFFNFLFSSWIKNLIKTERGIKVIHLPQRVVWDLGDKLLFGGKDRQHISIRRVTDDKYLNLLNDKKCQFKNSLNRSQFGFTQKRDRQHTHIILFSISYIYLYIKMWNLRLIITNSQLCTWEPKLHNYDIRETKMV